MALAARAKDIYNSVASGRERVQNLSDEDLQLALDWVINSSRANDLMRRGPTSRSIAQFVLSIRDELTDDPTISGLLERYSQLQNADTSSRRVCEWRAL